MERLSLDDMLAVIPSQLLDQKIESDVHLADIAKSLVEWKKARSYLGLNEAEEEAIWRDNPTQDEQRLVLVACAQESCKSRRYIINHLGCWQCCATCWMETAYSCRRSCERTIQWTPASICLLGC